MPYITSHIDRVELTADGAKTAYSCGNLTSSQRDELIDVVEQLAHNDSERHGKEHKIVFLDGAGGFLLDQPVANDKTANDSDTRVALVYGQRYVSAKKLRRSPEKTSELES